MPDRQSIAEAPESQAPLITDFDPTVEKSPAEKPLIYPEQAEPKKAEQIVSRALHQRTTATMIKKPNGNDYEQIYDLLDRAFAPSVAESSLVKKLKNNGRISFDFMINKKGRALAYVCYSPAYDVDRNKIGFHLAPVAVLPEKQRQGLGKRIIKESLKIVGTQLPVYVLGDPEYYKKTGFRIDKSQKCRFDPDGNHFMVLSRTRLPPREILYEDEFMEC